MDIESPIATKPAAMSTDHHRLIPVAPSTYRTVATSCTLSSASTVPTLPGRHRVDTLRAGVVSVGGASIDKLMDGSRAGGAERGRTGRARAAGAAHGTGSGRRHSSRSAVSSVT